MSSRISVLVSIVLAMLVTSIDTTITNTTMPVIAKDLAGFELYAWTFAAYMIVSTVLSPVAGRVSDLFGRKRVFACGIVLFLIGSSLCGSSRTMLQLVIYRGVQGVGAGVMIPFPAIIAGDIFPVARRGKIQAYFSAMWGISALLAPMLGAFFVQYATWRWIFYVNVPICILALLLLLPYQEEYCPKHSAIDYLGGVLFACGVSSLLATTLITKNQALYIGLGIICLMMFFLYEKRHDSPIVPLSLLRNKPVSIMSVNRLLSCAALFGTSSYVPLFLQHQGYSLFLSGVALLGSSIGWMTVAVPTGKWILRYGYRPLLIAGNLILVTSGVLLLFLNQSSGFWYVFVNMIVQGLAFGLLFTVSIIGSQQLVEGQQKGVSTSLQIFASNIGTAIGVTIMGAFLTKSGNFYAGVHALFVYGFIVSLFSLVSSFFLGAVKEEIKHNLEEKSG